MTLGVIGHVDHGKTALVRALTGMETDRLKEERSRGISIALGFAFLRAEGVREGATEIDFIDMPGHERFVRTMVAGATGIDAVLLVVAANEGIKPQTIEHLDIAALLGIGRATIAISKADLVDAAAIATVARAAKTLVRRAGLAVQAAIATSVVSGEGLDALRDALLGFPDDAPRENAGFAYLPIDRAFSITGHGTVVTGTLRRGALAIADEMEIVPGGRRVRLRGLQVHGARVARAEPGQRVAANLRDVAPDAVPRGAALATPGLLSPSRWLSVSLRAIEGEPALANFSRVMLLFGTEEIPVRLRLLDRDEVLAGESALAQLHCAREVSVPARENFILRRISPPVTLAGGRVIDPDAVRERRNARAPLSRLAALASADPAAIVRAGLSEAGAAGLSLTRLARLAGLAPAETAALVPLAEGEIGRAQIAARRADRDRIAAAIVALLAGQPAGLSREHLGSRLGWAGAVLLDEILAVLIRAGRVQRESGLLRIPHPAQDRERAAQEMRDAASLAEIVRHGGLAPPDLAADAASRRLLIQLVRAGVLVRVPDAMQKREILFHRDAIADAQRLLAPKLAEPPGLLVREAGAALGISRKYSVPLLEYLDAVGFTRRIADRRMLAQPR